MTEMVRVTCAPGCHFVVAPHPSGVAGMPSLLVHGGMTVEVSQARADRLWLARLILNPATGKPPPPPVAMQDFCPTVSVNRGPRQRLDGCVDWGPQPVPQPPSETAFRTLAANSDPVASITDIHGNAWPNF